MQHVYRLGKGHDPTPSAGAARLLLNREEEANEIATRHENPPTDYGERTQSRYQAASTDLARLASGELPVDPRGRGDRGPVPGRGVLEPAARDGRVFRTYDDRTDDRRVPL